MVLKFVFFSCLFFISLLVQAGDIATCEGSVLQRRVALVQFGNFVDAHITAKGALPDICATNVTDILAGVPELLKRATVCGSSKESAVYYSCQLPPTSSGGRPGQSPVIESCRYSLVDQSVSCENRSVVTTISEPVGQ